MPTLNQISNLPFENNLLANGLNMPDKSKLVYDLSGGYNVLDYIVTRNGSPRQIDGKDGQFEKPIMGVSVVSAVVASTQLNGLVLRVFFTDPTYDNFRNSTKVGDGGARDTMGIVIAHGAGYVDLVVAPPVTAWNTAVHFVSGSNIIEMFPNSVNRGSGAIESQYEYPTYVKNQTSILRDNVELYRRDLSSTWVEFMGDNKWALAQESILMQRVARAMEYKGLFDFYGTTNDPDGIRNHSMGLKASIKDRQRGGVYVASPNVLTESSFISWINEIADRRNAAMTSLTILVGRGFLSRVQTFTTKYIQYVGKNNTFGGESVQGLDVYEYAINGVMCKFIMAPILNDRSRFPTLSTIAGSGGFTKMQHTAICLDTDSYEARGGGMLPAMEKVYFGSEEMIMYYLPGVIGSNLKGADSSIIRNGNFAAAMNNNDSVMIGIYSDCAYDFMSYRSGWWELAS